MKKTLASLIVALAFAIFASSAHAALMLAGLVAGVPFCAADNNAACGAGQIGDLNPAIGIVSLPTTVIGGLTIEGSLHASIFGPPTNALNSSSLSITNNTGSTVNAEVAIGQTGYPGPAPFVESSGSGTWFAAPGSTINMTWYADAANQQGGQTFNDLPGILMCSFADLAGAGVDSFSTNCSVAPFGAAGPFSMSMGFNLGLVAGGSLISRGQNEITELAAVPEPATMMLLGTGLLAAFRYRKRV